MRTALYFPHTEVRSEQILRTALMTWDKLEFIVPYHGFRPHYDNCEMARAVEIVGRARVVTGEEQQQVHELVEDLLSSEIPEVLRYAPSSGAREPDYELWPQKLAHETWRLLKDRSIVGATLNNHDYPASQGAGLTLMALLADVLAGSTRTRITDRALAYATMTNATNGSSHDNDVVQVLPLTFKAISSEKLSLKRLVEFREREEKDGTGELQALRHNYLEAIERHVVDISKVAAGSSDRLELDRIFQSEMVRDFSDLKQELGFATKDAWFSTSMLTMVVVTGAAAVGLVAGGMVQVPEAMTGAGALVTIGGMLGTRNKLSKARYDLLRKHPTAYLYQLGI